MKNIELFEELASKLWWKTKINETNLASLMLENKSKIKDLLSKEENLYKSENNNTSWYLFFADFREYLGIPRYMNLDTFNAFSEVIMTSWENLNYDDFLKFFKKSKVKSKVSNKYNWPNVSKLINNQWEYIAQWLVELVANAIDASISEKNIGRFGEWFYQSLKFLKWWDSEIIVKTKKDWEKWFQINLKNENSENIIWSVWINKENNWTEIILNKNLSNELQLNLKSFLISRFKTNKSVQVILNWEKINDFSDYIYYNWTNLKEVDTKIFVQIDDNWFRVIDSWIWMSSRDLREKLLSPNMSWKKRLNSDSMNFEDLEKHTQNETSFFYKHFKDDKKILKNNELKEQKTQIRLQVWWVLIEEFESHTSYDIEEFCLEFPSFTWLPESRNKIELTKEVVISLKIALEKISDKIENQKEQLILIEIIAKIIKHLKSRESSSASTKSKYDINKVAKDTFKKIKADLEESGKIVLASIPGIQDILSNQENIVFVDEEFLNFDITKIPNIKKLANIKNKEKEFYEIEFSENAKYDYLILSNCVLVNSKYTTNTKDLDKINAQVNLNTWYEQWEDKVFYWIIEDNKLFEEEKKLQDDEIIDNNEEENEEYYDIELIKQAEKNYEKLLKEFEFILNENEINNILETIEFIKNNNYKFDIKRNAISVKKSYEIFVADFMLSTQFDISNNEFYIKFYNFCKENNKNIIDILLLFVEKIDSVKNIEKYLLQIMDLLEDEVNVKYIIEYLKELNKLEINDLENLFAKYEWEEIEEYNEINNSIYKDLNAIKSYLGLFNFTIKSFKFVWKNNEYFIKTNEWENILFIWDTFLTEIGWKKIKEINEIFISPTWEVIWTFIAEWENFTKLFVEDGKKIIDSINWNKITDFSSINFWANWEIIGICFTNWSKKLFKWDKIIESIWWIEYDTISKIYIWKNWKICGFIRDELYNWYLFNWDELIESINWRDLNHPTNLNILNNWNFIWVLNEWLFIWDEIIRKINWKKYDEILSLTISDNWKFYWWILKINWINKIFVWDRIIKTIWGYNYSKVYDLRILDNWEIIWTIELDYKDYFFKWDKLIREIKWDFYTKWYTENWEIRLEIDDKPYIWDIDVINYINSNEYEDYEDWISVEEAIENNYTLSDLSNNKIKHKKYSQKITSFVEFLCKWWEFLKEQDDKINFETQNKLFLTDIIWISRYFDEEIENIDSINWLEIISDLKNKISKKLKNRIPFERNITSTIDWQDRSSMIWLRESVQNSRDAILKAKRNWKENWDNIDIDFYQNNNSWTSRISDNIWMTTYEVFKYLLTPWKSWKENDETATWMFWQWFYSLSIWASKIKLKTSIWDWKTTYLDLSPKYNSNKDIIDFEIKYDIKSEEFTWTIIERIDESEWIWWNVWALIGLNNLYKYVWNVDDLSLKYNENNIFSKFDVKILEIEEIAWIWTLALKQNKDKQERFTKDNLFISEIKDEYLNFLPDFIIDYIRENWYSLDLPSNIWLTKTRNSITDFEENIEILRPHIFNIFTRHIVKEYLAGNLRLPMMPLDYYGLDLYEMKFNSNILNLASIVNNWWNLKLEQINSLKDKNLLIQYLINLKVENNWEIISIRDLKKRRDDEEFLRKHTANSYVINNNSKSLNEWMEDWDRNKIEKLSQEKSDYLDRVENQFQKLASRLFWSYINFWFYERLDKLESRAVDYWFNDYWNIYFNFNSVFASEFINQENYKTIELITHELTHLAEKFIKWYWIDFDKILLEWKNFKELVWYKINWKNTWFWTHQKDTEHNHSFEKIQRDILKLMTREWL